MVKWFQTKDPKDRLGSGQGGTSVIKQHKFFPTGFWWTYEDSYENKKHPKEDDTLEMVRNFNTNFTTLNLKEGDDFSIFNYNNKRTIQAPVIHTQQTGENQQVKPNPRNNSEYINICDPTVMDTLQAPVTRAQHKKKDQQKRVKSGVIYISDSSITRSYVSPDVSGSTQKLSSGYTGSSQPLKRMYKDTEPEHISHHKNRR